MKRPLRRSHLANSNIKLNIFRPTMLMFCPCAIFLVMAKANLIRYRILGIQKVFLVTFVMIKILRQLGMIHLTTPLIPLQSWVRSKFFKMMIRAPVWWGSTGLKCGEELNWIKHSLFLFYSWVIGMCFQLFITVSVLIKCIFTGGVWDLCSCEIFWPECWRPPPGVTVAII